MGFFGRGNKGIEANGAELAARYKPYKDGPTNLIYNLLFCDDIDLYKANVQPPYSYPYDILFSAKRSVDDLQKISNDMGIDPRLRALACKNQVAAGYAGVQKELFAVVVEVGLEKGLDVLAAFSNRTARYINQSSKILIWEKPIDAKANKLFDELFAQARQIVDRIGPWDKARKAPPANGYTRISFVVSNGLYFGEAPTNILFNDPLASGALQTATRLMQYLTERSLQESSKR